ncbi:MAG: TRAP transporter small permease [Alphaproteobacteria bacterium]|nr:MAG: TRAP transporter small permease [Alphaproteobacteria bacterium]
MHRAAAPALPGGAALRWVEFLSHALSVAANAAGSLVVLVLVAVVCFDVIARGFFHAPFHGAVEVVQFSMVMVVFLQLPDVVRIGRLTRSDGFLMMATRRRMPFAGVLNRGIELVSALFMALIAVTLWPDVVEMWETGGYFGVPGVFMAPWWPVKLVICLSAGLCALIFLFRTLRNQRPGVAPPALRIGGAGR